MNNTVILRGTVIAEPWYIEDSATTHFLLAFANTDDAAPLGNPGLCQVRCAGQLAGQVEAIVYHHDPVIVLGELTMQHPKRHDHATPSSSASTHTLSATTSPIPTKHSSSES